eukprot:TRINITY_DN9810_c0_g2_i1.p1 TRINITY_DN9810_c0_g2~~TRINITY_DN9810_c0_g2_i1.p1  ORF type:complete len:261 (-),score=29.05 TRINITY_DN9810_c0_g2_i1:423-1205(-)
MLVAYKYVRSMYSATKKRTTRVREVDEPSFSQVLSPDASEDHRRSSGSTCTAGVSCGQKVRLIPAEESFDVNGSDRDTFLPGSLRQTDTSCESAEWQRGSDLSSENADLVAGALAQEDDAACARSHGERKPVRERPMTRHRSPTTSAITLPSRFPCARQTMPELSREALSWRSETSSVGADSEVSSTDDARRAMHASPDDASAQSAARAKRLHVARQKMLEIRRSQVSLESKRVTSGRDSSRRNDYALALLRAKLRTSTT